MSYIYIYISICMYVGICICTMRCVFCAAEFAAFSGQICDVHPCTVCLILLRFVFRRNVRGPLWSAVPPRLVRLACLASAQHSRLAHFPSPAPSSPHSAAWTARPAAAAWLPLLEIPPLCPPVPCGCSLPALPCPPCGLPLGAGSCTDAIVPGCG